MELLSINDWRNLAQGVATDLEYITDELWQLKASMEKQERALLELDNLLEFQEKCLSPLEMGEEYANMVQYYEQYHAKAREVRQRIEAGRGELRQAELMLRSLDDDHYHPVK